MENGLTQLVRRLSLSLAPTISSVASLASGSSHIIYVFLCGSADYVLAKARTQVAGTCWLVVSTVSLAISDHLRAIIKIPANEHARTWPIGKGRDAEEDAWD